jgi:hypothetical protein
MRLHEILHALWEGRAEPPGLPRLLWECAVIAFAVFLFCIGVVALIAVLAFADAYLPKSGPAKREDRRAAEIGRSLDFRGQIPTLNSKCSEGHRPFLQQGEMI